MGDFDRVKSIFKHQSFLPAGRLQKSVDLEAFPAASSDGVHQKKYASQNSKMESSMARGSSKMAQACASAHVPQERPALIIDSNLNFQDNLSSEATPQTTEGSC